MSEVAIRIFMQNWIEILVSNLMFQNCVLISLKQSPNYTTKLLKTVFIINLTRKCNKICQSFTIKFDKFSFNELSMIFITLLFIYLFIMAFQNFKFLILCIYQMKFSSHRIWSFVLLESQFRILILSKVSI